MGGGARSTELVDAVVERLREGMAFPDQATVEAEFVPEIADPDSDAPLGGRRVWVMDDAEGVDPFARKLRLRDFAVRVLVAVRYPDQGEPPKEWVRSQIRWVEERVWEPLSLVGYDFDRKLLGSAWPSGSEIVAKYDRGLLRHQKVFASEIVFRFQESASV